MVGRALRRRYAQAVSSGKRRSQQRTCISILQRPQSSGRVDQKQAKYGTKAALVALDGRVLRSLDGRVLRLEQSSLLNNTLLEQVPAAMAQPCPRQATPASRRLPPPPAAVHRSTCPSPSPRPSRLLAALRRSRTTQTGGWVVECCCLPSMHPWPTPSLPPSRHETASPVCTLPNPAPA